MNPETRSNIPPSQNVPVTLQGQLRRKRLFPCVFAALGFTAFFLVAIPVLAADAPSLGTAESFGLLAGSGVVSTGVSTVDGDLGMSPGELFSGFPPGQVIGTIYINDPEGVAVQAKADAFAAYTNLAGQTSDIDLTGQDLGGQTLTPGVYTYSAAAPLTGTLTLDAQGVPNAVFVIQIGSALTSAANSKVNVINGGSECNVFWQLGSSATLGAGTEFAGNMLAYASITMSAGVTIKGRALAHTGTVTMDAGSAGGCAVRPKLTVTVTGNGTVSAAAIPAPFTGGIVDCDSSLGSQCMASYALDAAVTLEATPSTGQHVTWGGDCAADGTVTMDADHICSAAFAPNTHTVGGSVANLAGSGLILHLDYEGGSEDLSAGIGDTDFAFTSGVPYGTNYTVSVTAQPIGLSQTCSIVNAAGTMPDSNVTDVSVNCITDTYTIGGTVTGLTSTGLILQLNGGHDLAVSGSNFTFGTQLASGSSYVVNIRTEPSDQACTVSHGVGTVTNANITSVTVDCIGHPLLTLAIDDGRTFARYGQTLDYLVTLANSGAAAANDVHVEAGLSAAFDGANARWQCIGAGSRPSCRASQLGALSDTVTVPVGQILTWIVSVPVLFDTALGVAQIDVSASGATTVSDIDTLVIFRDGFDVANADGTLATTSAPESAAVLRGNGSVTFRLPPAGGGGIDTVRTLRDGDAVIKIQRLMLDHATYIRLLAHPKSGEERVSVWMPMAASAELSIGSVADKNGQRIVLLEGASQSVTLSLTH